MIVLDRPAIEAAQPAPMLAVRFISPTALKFIPKAASLREDKDLNLSALASKALATKFSGCSTDLVLESKMASDKDFSTLPNLSSKEANFSPAFLVFSIKSARPKPSISRPTPF